MPFPLIPFLFGAATGAIVTYLFSNKEKDEETADDKESSAAAEPSEAKDEAS